MNFYNKHLYQLVRHVDPSGMLNVAGNVFMDRQYLYRYFSTDNDFQKLDVPWMCEQLIILLANFNDVIAISSSIQFIQNDFQRIKYSFVLISQAFIGLVLIQENSIKTYYRDCQSSALSLNKKKIDKVPRKKKIKKSDVINHLHQEEVILNQPIKQLSQNQVMTKDKEIDVLLTSNIQLSNDQNILNCNNKKIVSSIYSKSDLDQQSLFIQPIEEFPVFNQNVLTENLPLSTSLLKKNVITIDKVQSTNLELLELIEQLHYGENVKDQQIQAKPPNDIIHLQEKSNQVSSEKNAPDQPLKRKKSTDSMKKFNKKRPIEKSNKVIKNRLKKLEGELLNRPLEIMALNYIHHSINHMPLRYATYNKHNLSMVAINLYMELEENKNQDNVFNNTMTMGSYKTTTDKLNNFNNSNTCIYQQCMNNSLPHLSLLPIAEDYSNNISLVWRDTINEINKKLEDSLKDISHISKGDQNKWEEFKEKIKHRVCQSLVTQKTLIGSETSHLDLSQPPIIFPSSHQIEELLNGKSLIESRNSREGPQVNINDVNQMPSLNPNLISYNKSPNLLLLNKSPRQLNINQYEQDKLPYKNNIEPSIICQQTSIDAMQMIFNILEQSPEKISSLVFTDLCPLYITNRLNAVLVMADLLGLHKKGTCKLSQPHNTMTPSSILIKFIV